MARKNENARDRNISQQLKYVAQHHRRIHGEKPRAMSESTGRGHTARDVAHVAQTDLFEEKKSQ